MKSYSEIDAQELFDLITKTQVLLVDVRNQDEVDRGIISGALHMQLSTLPLEYTKLKQKKPVVFYCHSGIRSAHAADFATAKGIGDTHNLIGGIVAWQQAGLPLAKE